jgi:hypothetical protein
MKDRAVWQEAPRVLGRFGRWYAVVSLRNSTVGQTYRGYRTQRESFRSAVYFGQGRIFMLATGNYNERLEDHVHDFSAHQVYRQHIVLPVPTA